MLDRECYRFTEPFESTVLHQYQDTGGVVTVGTGIALRSLADVARLSWTPNPQAACADFTIVSLQAKGHLASFYRQFCVSRLRSDPRELFLSRLHDMQALIATRWKLYDQPLNAQVALSDLVFNCGPAGLNKFAKLHAAVMARDWETAAVESRRKKPVSDERNAAVAALFRALVG
ncbi:MAG: hypothetical protein RL701_5988 [Pseudomonadota bacterium]